MNVLEGMGLWLWPNAAGRYISGDLSRKWHNSRRSHAAHIVSAIGEADLRLLDKSHTRRIQDGCLLAGLSPESTNAVTHNAFSGFVRDMIDLGHCPPEIHARVRQCPELREDKRQKWRPYEADTRDEFLEYCDRHTEIAPHAAILHLGGLRIGEAAGLMPCDFDWRRGSMRIERSREGSYVTPCKEEGAQRTIWMSDPLARYLYPLRGRTEEWFLPGFRRPRMGIGSFRINQWYPAIERGGFPRIHPHVARHSWVTTALREGVSPAEVAAHIGDTVAVVLSTYAHVMPPKDANRCVGYTPPDSPPPVTEIVRDRQRPFLRVVK